MELAEITEKALRDIAQNANAKIVFYDLALRTIILIQRKH